MTWWSRSSVSVKAASVVALVGVLAILGALLGPRLGGRDADDYGPIRRDSNLASASANGKPADLGTIVALGSNYDVAVTRVVLYEGADDRLILATVKAKFVGKEDGDPWVDLVARFTGADSSRTFAESSCPMALEDASDSDAPAMGFGDVRTYKVCIDVPTTKTDGGKITLEETASAGAAASWSTDGAAKKTLPSPAPTTPAEPTSEAPSTVPRHSDEHSGSDSYDSDAAEEYKEKLDRAIEKGERLRDRIKATLAVWKRDGHDRDEIEDAEKYLERLEDQIDDYKEARDRLD